MHLSEAAAAASFLIASTVSERDQQILDAREEGLTLADIASRIGASIDMVTRSITRMRAAGITIPDPGGNDRIWSAERIKVLRKHAADGWSAARVAAAIGLTRNAVLGKAKRLGVTFDPEKVQSKSPIEGKVWWTPDRVETLRRLAAAGSPSSAIATELGTTAQKVRDKASGLGISLKAPQPRATPKPAVQKAAAEIAEVNAPAPDEDARPEGKGIGSATSRSAAPVGAITIHVLSLSRCCWPFGDPRDDDFRYCGAPVAPATRERSRFYCDGHMKAAGGMPARGRGR